MRTVVEEEELGRQWWWTLELFLEGNGAGARRLYRWHYISDGSSGSQGA
jgi:hypothetical protein